MRSNLADMHYVHRPKPKVKGCSIGCLPLILLLIILWLLTRCAVLTEPPRAFTVRADFFVTTVKDNIAVCHKERCEMAIANNKIELHTRDRFIVVDHLKFICYSWAVGLDQDGQEWEVMVGNMRKDPYILLLKSTTVAILVGYECY